MAGKQVVGERVPERGGNLDPKSYSLSVAEGSYWYTLPSVRRLTSRAVAALSACVSTRAERGRAGLERLILLPFSTISNKMRGDLRQRAT